MTAGDGVIAAMVKNPIGSNKTKAIIFEKRPLLIKTGTRSAIAIASEPHLSQVKMNRFEMTDSRPFAVDEL